MGLWESLGISGLWGKLRITANMCFVLSDLLNSLAGQQHWGHFAEEKGLRDDQASVYRSLDIASIGLRGLT